MRRPVFAAAAFLCGLTACGGQPDGGETQEAYMERCTQETIAANPQASEWAESVCAQQWETVVAAGPIVEAILAAEPETAAPVDPASVAARLPMVQWDARPEGGWSPAGVWAMRSACRWTARGRASTSIGARWAQ